MRTVCVVYIWMFCCCFSCLQRVSLFGWLVSFFYVCSVIILYIIYLLLISFTLVEKGTRKENFIECINRFKFVLFTFIDVAVFWVFQMSQLFAAFSILTFGTECIDLTTLVLVFSTFPTKCQNWQCSDRMAL